MEKTICFTGHRPNKMAGYKHENYCSFLNSLEEHLQKYLDAGFTRFITSGAQGADQLAFWAVHRLKLHNPNIPIQNIAYIPFNGLDSRWSEAGAFSKDDYRKMLRCADEIVICCPDVSPNSNFSDICKALYKRNTMMVDASQQVIAICKEIEVQQNKVEKGGTGHAVNYALSKQKPIDMFGYKVLNGNLVH